MMPCKLNEMSCFELKNLSSIVYIFCVDDLNFILSLTFSKVTTCLLRQVLHVSKETKRD